jgi:hypothetical protein
LPQAAIENPITAIMAIIPKSPITFFITNHLLLSEYETHKGFIAINIAQKTGAYMHIVVDFI